MCNCRNRQDTETNCRRTCAGFTFTFVFGLPILLTFAILLNLDVYNKERNVRCHQGVKLLPSPILTNFFLSIQGQFSFCGESVCAVNSASPVNE
jgi:hypothetical protein